MSELNKSVYLPSSQRRKTLGLTGVTLHAMALIAPGVLMWLLYQAQVASQIDGAADIWPGVLAALLVAILTSLSLAQLMRRYPNVGLRGAFQFFDPILREKMWAGKPGRVRALKIAIGWSANLYYWIYPGLIVAFTGVLADYLFRQLGYHPTLLGQLILTFSFSALIGFLALRGITGSITSSVVINVIQLVMLLVFGGAALVFRWQNPLHLTSSEWLQPDWFAVLVPHSPAGVLFQAALAMALMVGFEDASALRSVADHPARDIPRATVLALLIQGALAYLLGYFTAGLALNERLVTSPTVGQGMAALAQSRSPIGDLVLQLGNVLFSGNGIALLLAMSFSIFIALLGSALTAMNTSVRVSFSMEMDPEMPSVVSFLPARHATPYGTVVLLAGVSAIIGSLGALGGVAVLMGLILAANLGALVLYGLLCFLSLGAFKGMPQSYFLAPILGGVVNLGLAVAFPIIGISSGGLLAQVCWLTLGIATLWVVICAAYFLVIQTRNRRLG
jgi:amino acid transporter